MKSLREAFEKVAPNTYKAVQEAASAEFYADIVMHVAGSGCSGAVARCIEAAGGMEAARKSGELAVMHKEVLLQTQEDMRLIQPLLNALAKEIKETYPRLVSIHAEPDHQVRLTIENYDFRYIMKPPTPRRCK